VARAIITSEQWERAREYFEHGLTLSEVAKKTGISKGAIGKKANLENWDKESPKRQVLSQAVEVSRAKETLRDTPVSLEVHEELYDEALRHKRLIYDNATKLADKLRKLTDEVDNAQDMRHLVEANDKLSITLKVNERHAPKTEINNTNATQNNTKRVTIARRSDR